MPRTLADLSDEERKALLNAHWDRLNDAEIALPVGTNAPIASPLGKTGPVPSDLAAHLIPGRGAGLTHAWNVNGICDEPGLGLKDKVSQPAANVATLGRGGGT
jgi:hypothetical protein